MPRGKSQRRFSMRWTGFGAFLLVCSTLTSISSPVSAADDDSVLGQDGGSLILVLDGSGSMKEPAGGGRTRMEAAKDGLNGVIDELPQDSKVGLRVYGSTIEDGTGSCKDSELLAPVADVDPAALKKGVTELKPLGNTPIAYSLEKAFADLPSEGPRSIVLVSDGEENCGGDPCKVARDLKKKGADFYVDVVGLQVDDKSRNQLTCIASAGGGTFYDVKDIEELESTLTRTSTRAARGYQPAGIPVEGGTDAGSAAEIEDGQWLDTVGDSGVEHYLVPSPGKGTLHVSAATPPSAESIAAADGLEIELTSQDGTACGSGADAFVQAAGNEEAPLTVAYSATPEARKSCGDGPYVLAVSSPDVEGTQSLEIFVRSEPEVTTTQGLPAAAGASGFSDQTEGEAASGEPVAVVGSPNFSAAPPTAPGAYQDGILPGETLFYRVPDVAFGQQVVCDATLEPTPEASAALDEKKYQMPVTASVYGPLKSEIPDGSSALSRQFYDGAQTTEVHAATPVVTYLNRDTGQASLGATAIDGSYYCAITALTAAVPNVTAVGEIPLTLTVSTVGKASGEPEYASPPKETANDKLADEADGRLGWPWIVGGIVVLGALAVGLLAALRRRGKATSTETEPGGTLTG